MSKRARTSIESNARAYKKPAPAKREKKHKKDNKSFTLINKFLIPASDSVVNPSPFNNSSAISAGVVGAAYSNICLNSGLTAAAVGNARVGRRIYMSAISLKINVGQGQTGFNSGRFCAKLVYFKDVDSATVLPDASHICDISYNASPDACVVAHSTSNLLNASNFKVIRGWDFELNSQTHSNEISHVIDDYIPLKGKETCWAVNDSTGLFTGMTKGALVLYTGYYISAANGSTTIQAAAKTTCPVASVNARLYYTDN